MDAQETIEEGRCLASALDLEGRKAADGSSLETTVQRVFRHLAVFLGTSSDQFTFNSSVSKPHTGRIGMVTQDGIDNKGTQVSYSSSIITFG